MSAADPRSPTGLVRPYVGIPRAPRAEAGRAPRAVRPYSITGGRTRPCRPEVGVETILVTAEQARHRAGGLCFERRTIVTLCEAPRSVAEISAELGVPVGVTAVLVADMAAEGLLEMSRAPDAGADVDLVKRLIDGVRAL